MLVKVVMELGIPVIGSVHEGLGCWPCGAGGTVPCNGKLHLCLMDSALCAGWIATRPGWGARNDKDSLFGGFFGGGWNRPTQNDREKGRMTEGGAKGRIMGLLTVPTASLKMWRGIKGWL